MTGLHTWFSLISIDLRLEVATCSSASSCRYLLLESSKKQLHITHTFRKHLCTHWTAFTHIKQAATYRNIIIKTLCNIMRVFRGGFMGSNPHQLLKNQNCRKYYQIQCNAKPPEILKNLFWLCYCIIASKEF